MLTILLIGCVGFSRAASIEVTTCDDRDVNLPSVEIVVYRSNQNIPIALFETDAEGEIIIAHLSGGLYRIQASRTGFDTVQTPFLRLAKDSVQRVTIRLIPALDTTVSTIRPALVRIRESRFPSLVRSLPQSSDRLLASFDTVDQLIDRGLMLLDPNGHVLFPSSRGIDSSVMLDQYDLTDPAFNRPYLIPPAAFLWNMDIVTAGLDAPFAISSAGSVGLYSRTPNEKPFSVSLLRSQAIYNSGRFDSGQARDAFSYWREHGHPDYSAPEDNPNIRDNETAALIEFNLPVWKFLAAGTLIDSSHSPISGHINPDYRDDKNIWIKNGLNLTPRMELLALVGYQESWRRPRAPFELRMQDPIISYRTGYFAALSLRYRLISGDLVEIDVYSTGSDREKGELHDGRIVGPDENNPPVVMDDYRYSGDWSSQKSGFASRFHRTSRSHVFLIQAGMQLIDGDGREQLLLGPGANGAPENESRADYSFNDYTAAIWGSDRWFATENLEITTIVRWDRYNYLVDRDNLSPRLDIGYHRFGLRFFGGVERIVQAPPASYLTVRFTPDASDPDTSFVPTSGLRWFLGAGGSNSHSLSYSFGICHTDMSDPFETTRVQLTGGVYRFAPIRTRERTSDSISLDLQYSREDRLRVSAGYLFSYAQVHSPSIALESFFDPMPESRFPLPDQLPDESASVKLNDSIQHRIHGVLDYALFPAHDVRAEFQYFFSSGRPYTPVIYNPASPEEFRFGQMNSRRAQAWHRFDLALLKDFRLMYGVRIQTALRVKNLFNTWQDAPVDPSTGFQTYDPYANDSNLPRIFSIEAGIRF